MFALLSLAAALAVQPVVSAPGDTSVEETPGRELSITERLEERLRTLAASESASQAQTIADEVLSLWRQQAGATAQLLLERGDRAMDAGEAGLAERQYAHLRRLEPDFSEAWVVSAEAAMVRDDWDFALEALERAIALEPARFDAYVLLGRTLEQADSAAGALAAYEAALAIHPHHEAARNAAQRLEERLSGRAL